MTGERAYRALLLLYPRRFRREYRDPMLQLYRDERRDRTASWRRLAGDVLLSVPCEHKEAFRIMSTQAKLVTAALVTATGIAVFFAIGGAIVALLLMLLLVWILTALLRERRATPSPATWWKLTLSGVAVFALAFVFFAGPWPDEWREAVPGDVAWGVGGLVFAFSLVMVLVGLLAGFVQLIGRRRLTQ